MTLADLLATYAQVDLTGLPHCKGDFDLVAVVDVCEERFAVGEWPVIGFDAERCDGWIRYRSELSFASDPWDEEFGPPLAGEWVRPDGTTARIGPDPVEPGTLLLRRIASRRISADIEAITDEKARLRQFEWLLRADGEGYLAFEVYWGFDDAGVLRRLSDRFIGFSEARA